LPFFIGFIQNIEFNGVISCSDCLDIPINEAQGLVVVDVVHVQNTKEEDKQDNTQSKNLNLVSVSNFVCWNLARDLNEEGCMAAAFLLL